MKALVTGGAGFIGSHLVDRLLQVDQSVIAFDNFSTGKRRFLDNAQNNDRFELVEGDLLNECQIESAMQGVDFVWHLAANADVRFGTDRPRQDLEQNTIATANSSVCEMDTLHV